MFDYIPITYLNDFIFCPRSIYFHQLCDGEDRALRHRESQTNGLIKHKSIDGKSYSNRKDVLQGIFVYCQQYKLCGKIDLFDKTSGILSERKARIKAIYDGYVFQLYAQYFALSEMGYNVSRLRLYSYEDNKSYSVPPPSQDGVMLQKFEDTIEKIRAFCFEDDIGSLNKQKCLNCIYEPLCDVCLC